MDSALIAAAILTAGFVGAQRPAMNTGRLEDLVMEKFVEYLEFVRAQSAPRAAAASARKIARRKRRG